MKQIRFTTKFKGRMLTVNVKVNKERKGLPLSLLQKALQVELITTFPPNKIFKEIKSIGTLEIRHIFVSFVVRCTGMRKDWRRIKKGEPKDPKFSKCCLQGKVLLLILKEPPLPLCGLLKNEDPKSRTFLDNIRSYNDLELSDDQLKNYTLFEIEFFLRSNGNTLRYFPMIPFPDDMLMSEGRNKLIQDELQYDKTALHQEHEKPFSSLTDEQKEVYNKIMGAVERGEGGVFFIYGYGGTGKTFIWRTLCAAIRSKGEIVLPVASSGIASLLLPRGRTAHSRFKIPLSVTEDSTCNIKPGSDLAELLMKTSLIIWDEAPMINKFCFEARRLRDVLRPSDQPFGGKVIVFGGDFRQILPVIPKGSRQDIVFSTINSSYLWNFCEVLKLTRNMRLQVGRSDSNNNEIREFSEWILKIGDGKVGEPNDGEGTVEIHDDNLITEATNPVEAIVNSTYPSILQNLWDPKYFQERAILAPTHDNVEAINDYLLSLMPREEKEYLSSDTIDQADTIWKWKTCIQLSSLILLDVLAYLIIG
ncbi:ATP-dependent DNA helicase pfh1-like [Spinacia oleracea]|uniref:ATP-dependent DNA helicase n=1 Tax=Spinacia oleracea TaxID=3562 RepID=A0ABM3R3X6_SPIOL|nr:ATP-dependent DNA helicase pfh1-like [Spinacia oleracea]